jgi:hypothetical protein
MILKLEFEIFYAVFFLFINFILFIVNIGENIADSKTKLELPSAAFGRIFCFVENQNCAEEDGSIRDRFSSGVSNQGAI